MIHSVSKEMITVIQCVPRIAERITPATAAQLKVSCCPLHLSCLSINCRRFLCFSTPHVQQPTQPSSEVHPQHLS